MSAETDDPYILAKFDAIEDVDIDGSGKFKYILIKLYKGTNSSEFKYIVRGHAWAEFHGDIYDKIFPSCSALGLETECVGGGRILHEPDQKHIKVYGYSQGFGKPDHSISVDLLKKKYKDYTNIEWSDEGY